MDNVSRPLIALLLGTVAFFALWLVALRGGASTPGSSSSSQGLGVYQSAIAKAHQAVATSNAASAAHGGTVITTPSTSSPRPASAPAATTPASAPVKQPATAAAKPAGAATTGTRSGAPAAATAASSTAATRRLGVVTRALDSQRVLALLFYNPSATDDRAVVAELAAVPRHRGAVVTLAVPVSELARYSVVTSQVMVNQSPTLVLIDRQRQASTIVGFSDRFEIAQRVADALMVP